MQGCPRKVLCTVSESQREIISRFMPWFGNTLEEVMVNLSMRWIEQNIANVSINALEHLGAFNRTVPSMRPPIKSKTTARSRKTSQIGHRAGIEWQGKTKEG